MDNKEIWYEDMDWIQLAQDRVEWRAKLPLTSQEDSAPWSGLYFKNIVSLNIHQIIIKLHLEMFKQLNVTSI
jgi:hypothetical protein